MKPTETNMNYNEYTVAVGTEEYMFTSSGPEDAARMADKMERMIQSQFPGINVVRNNNLGAPTPTRGPEQSVIDEIDAWVASNWTAAIGA